MAYIEKRGNSYRVKYDDPKTGRERSRTFTRQGDADRFLTTTKADQIRGTWVDPLLARTPFSVYGAAWRETLKGEPGTLLNIDGRLRNHVLPFFGSFTLEQIKPSHVRAWMTDMSAQGLAPATVKAAYWTFKSILDTAVIDGYLARTPCVGITLPRDTSHQEMRFLNAEKVSALAGAITPSYNALILTAAYTGLRWGELAALKAGRVHLLKRQIDVWESLAEINGHLHTGPTKTGTRRSVRIPRFLTDVLGEHIGRDTDPDGYVFTSPEGGPLRRNFYRRHFKPAVIAAGLDPGLRFHDLRHTCASLLIAQGAHPKQIQEQLGHSTIRLTLDRYSHLLPGLTDSLQEGLDRTYAGVTTPISLPSGGSKVSERRLGRAQ
jgi:integrase